MVPPGKGHRGGVCGSGLCRTPDPRQRRWFRHVSPCGVCQRVPLALGDSRRREQSALSLHRSSAAEALPSPCSLSPFKNIKQPDKNNLDPFNVGICCQLVSGAASLLSGLLFEVSFSCRAVDALRSAGVTAASSIWQEGRSLGKGSPSLGRQVPRLWGVYPPASLCQVELSSLGASRRGRGRTWGGLVWWGPFLWAWKDVGGEHVPSPGCATGFAGRGD